MAKFNPYSKKYSKLQSCTIVEFDANSREGKWFLKNCQPTYRDQVLKEHLYSMYPNDEGIETPKYIDKFLKELSNAHKDIAYLRFVTP